MSTEEQKLVSVKPAPLPKVSVTIIARNSEETIGACISSFVEYVDEIVLVLAGISKDKTGEVAKAISDKVKVFNWEEDINEEGEINHFAAARNFALSKVSPDCDWFMWVDSDDVVVNPQNIKQLASKMPPAVGAVWFSYQYAFDEFNNLSMVYERERLLRTSVDWVWKGRIHETLVPLSPCQYLRSDDVVIKHSIAHQSRSVRNFRLLKIWQGEEPDEPRLNLYLGHQHLAEGNFSESAEYYIKFTTMDVPPLEKYQALCYAAKALRSMKDKQAIEVILMAIELYPQYKDAYCELSQAYFTFGEFNKAIHWSMVADSKDVPLQSPPALIFINPLDYTYNKYILLAESYLATGQVDLALEWFMTALKMRPLKELKARIEAVKAVKERMAVDYGLKALSVNLLSSRELTKLQKLLDIVPYWYKELPDYQQMAQGIASHTPVEQPDIKITGSKLMVIANTVPNLREFLAGKKDFSRVKIKVVEPQPNLPVNFVAAYSQKDLEEIVTSEKGRHLINLHSTREGLVCEYDNKIPKGLSIRVFVGQGLEPWSPLSIEELGSGGSELAVAYTCRELAKLGSVPLVYAMNNQIWDGVIYRHYPNFKPDYPPCDLFIGSRVPGVFNSPIAARQKWLWLHDIHCGNTLTPEVAQELDVIVVLSQWHLKHIQRTYPFLKDCFVIDFNKDTPTFEDSEYTPATFFPDATIARKPVMAIIRDGINFNGFLADIPRQKNRFIWASSVDRGLEELLSMWSIIKKSLPEAELHIFYGWNYFDAWFQDNLEMMTWKNKILKMSKQPGVIWHGRVGQRQLKEEWLKSDLWLYPPHPFRETCCIAAMEAQAAGVRCFYRMNGALGETIGDRGIPIPLDTTPDKIIELLQNSEDYDRVKGRDWVRQYTWKWVAESILELYRRIESGKM